MKDRAVLLLAFANPQEDLDTHQEYELIRQTCKNEKAQQLVECALPSFATRVDQIFEDLRKYYDRLSIFHFAGHSGPNQLRLQDMQMDGQHINALLAQLPQLKLVFLNGCNTAKQAKKLSEQVPVAVIGTTDYINDTLAREFAEAFYKNFFTGLSLQESVDNAQAEMSYGTEASLLRASERNQRKQKQLPTVWQLYCEKPALLQWKLTDFDPNPQKHQALIKKTLQRMASISSMFNTYSNAFHQLANSHLPRKETTQLLQWIEDNLKASVEPIKVLAGNAGYGKTVIMKDLLAELQQKAIPVLALKADVVQALPASRPLKRTWVWGMLLKKT